MNRESFHQWCQTNVTSVPVSTHYLKKPLIMGVLNVTPDSFSDGGHFLKPEQAYQRAMDMIEEGANIIDVGGESSKPGAEPVSNDEELSRVLPVIERIRANSDVCISIDTYKADVMQSAAVAGASMINDIKALTDEGALETAARLRLPICLMHMQGTPKTMQDAPQYARDIIDDINDFFLQRIDACLQAGILRENLILDPGFGFGKTVLHNLCVTKKLVEFQRHRMPLLLGVSRKSTIGAVLQKTISERLTGGIAIALFAALQGVSIIRTHDVSETNQALCMLDAIINQEIEKG